MFITRVAAALANSLASPLVVFSSLWRNRSLIGRLAGRDVLARHRDTLMGLLWSLISPALMLVVYTFVFTTVFQARWDTVIDSREDFALILFAGLLVFWLFSDCVSRAPGLVLENASYVKKVVFPLESLSWVTLFSALFHTFMCVIALLVAYTALKGTPPWTAALLPIVLFPLALFTVGLSWFLSSLGVYLRDLRQVVPVLVTLLLFTSPIFYPLSAVPAPFRGWVALNPLAQVIEQVRDVLIFGRVPQWRELAIAAGLAWLTAWLGLVWFSKTRRGFADVV